MTHTITSLYPIIPQSLWLAIWNNWLLERLRHMPHGCGFQKNLSVMSDFSQTPPSRLWIWLRTNLSRSDWSDLWLWTQPSTVTYCLDGWLYGTACTISWGIVCLICLEFFFPFFTFMHNTVAYSTNCPNLWIHFNCPNFWIRANCPNLWVRANCRNLWTHANCPNLWVRVNCPNFVYVLIVLICEYFPWFQRCCPLSMELTPCWHSRLFFITYFPSSS